MSPSIPSRWSTAIVHPRSLPASRFLARLVAYDAAARPKLRRLAPIAGSALALRQTLSNRRPDPAVDAILDAVHRDWPDLVAKATPGRLPHQPPARDGMSVLVLERSAARTIFVFGTAPTPLVVAKLGDVATEEQALARAAAANATPKPLGHAAGAFLQEGVPGLPLDYPDLSPADVLALRWSRPFRSLGQAVIRITEATRTREAPAELAAPIDAAVNDDRLPDAIRPTLKAVADDAARINTAVLRHGDLSGQNWLVHDDAVTGLVDWETAIDSGVPGFDILHAAVSWLEQALVRSGADDNAVIAGFDAAWDRSPFFAGARKAALDAAAAAGVPAPLHDALIVAFFARRLGRRLRFGPDDPAAGKARRMLDAVCR